MLIAVSESMTNFTDGIISIICQLSNLIVPIMLFAAIMRIFSLEKTLKKILEKLGEMDENRRDEFNALSDQQ